MSRLTGFIKNKQTYLWVYFYMPFAIVHIFLIHYLKHTIIEDMEKKNKILTHPEDMSWLEKWSQASGEAAREREEKERQTNSYIIEQWHHQHSTPTCKQRCTYTKTHRHKNDTDVTVKMIPLPKTHRHTPTHSKACTDYKMVDHPGNRNVITCCMHHMCRATRLCALPLPGLL